jgi:hypothetical protein
LVSQNKVVMTEHQTSKSLPKVWQHESPEPCWLLLLGEIPAEGDPKPEFPVLLPLSLSLFLSS